MKKIIAALLAVLLILSVSVCLVIYAEPMASEVISTLEEEIMAPDPEDIQILEEEPDVYHVPPAEDPDAVVRFYLCSKLNSGNVSHMFIYAENLTDEPVKVGLITLEKDQGVSMGAFGLQRSDGWGVYYNTESYRFTEKDYSTIVALCEELDEAHLEKLNKFLQYNNHWDLFFNCVFFAVGAWNSCTDNFVMPISIPRLVRLQLDLRPHTTLSQMYVPPREDVYYVDGNGKNAELIICSDESIDR